MYSPDHYTSQQTDLAKQVMQEFDLATLVCVHAGALQISHLPLVVDEHQGRPCLLGHMAKANPQWKIFTESPRVTVIFRGPDHYISPAWYVEREDNVPTWNFAAIHIDGHVELVTDVAETLTVLQTQVNWWESRLGTNWKLNTEFTAIQQLSNGIVAFRIFPEAQQIKFKLSQKQSSEDWQNVVQALEALPSESARQVAKLMKATRFKS